VEIDPRIRKLIARAKGIVPRRVDETRLAEIDELDLFRLEVEDADLLLLAPLTGLRVLRLGRRGVTDLSLLPDLPELDALSLWDTAVRDLSPLVRFPTLRRLEIEGGFVTDLAPLAALPRLAELRLVGLPTSDPAPLAERAGFKISLRP
jgi:Leucine-rich repeat (LRR) protein